MLVVKILYITDYEIPRIATSNSNYTSIEPNGIQIGPRSLRTSTALRNCEHIGAIGTVQKLFIYFRGSLAVVSNLFNQKREGLG